MELKDIVNKELMESEYHLNYTYLIKNTILDGQTM